MKALHSTLQLSRQLGESIVSQSSLAAVRASSASLHLLTASSNSKDTELDDIRADLQSTTAAVRLTAMLKIVSIMARGHNVQFLFADVIKCVVSDNSMEMRKLTSAYVLRYAHSEPDLALMCVNSVQRDMSTGGYFSGGTQLTRTVALRTMCGLGCPELGQICLLSLQKLQRNISPYVRRIVAHCVCQVFDRYKDLDHSDLVAIVKHLLTDNSVMVVAGAIQSFRIVCPNNFYLLHKNYRKLCRMLLDMEEWAQVLLIETLQRYARTQFVRPADTDTTQDVSHEEFVDSNQTSLDADYKLLLDSCVSLLHHQNSAVVYAAAILIIDLGTETYITQVATPLLRSLRSNIDISFASFKILQSLSETHPQLLTSRSRYFLLRETDSLIVARLKADILIAISTSANIQMIFQELKECVKSPRIDFARLALRTLHRLALRHSSLVDSFISLLVTQIDCKDDQISSEGSILLRSVLHKSTATVDVLAICAKELDRINDARARSSLLWITGQHHELIPKLVPDIIRRLAISFSKEDEVVRLQVLHLASKALFMEDKTKKVQKIVKYIFALARVDSSVYVRERCRILSCVFRTDGVLIGDRHKEFINVSKKVELQELRIQLKKTKYITTSMSNLVESKVDGYEKLPDFTVEPSDTSIRDLEAGTSSPWVPAAAIPTSMQTVVRPYSAPSQQPRQIMDAVQDPSNLDWFLGPTVDTPSKNSEPSDSEYEYVTDSEAEDSETETPGTVPLLS